MQLSREREMDDLNFKFPDAAFKFFSDIASDTFPSSSFVHFRLVNDISRPNSPCKREQNANKIDVLYQTYLFWIYKRNVAFSNDSQSS